MSRPASLPLMFWLVWMSLTSGLAVMRTIIGYAGSAANEAGIVDIVALTLLTTGICARWIVLPKLPGPLTRKLPPFIVSLALIEACALAALFFGPRHREELLLLGFLGLLSSAPFFALKRQPDNPA